MDLTQALPGAGYTISSGGFQMSNGQRSAREVELSSLLNEFYSAPADPRAVGEFAEVTELPQPYQGLLDHEHHMTVTVEAHGGEPVVVRVHQQHRRARSYAREITLAGSRSGQTVQYGIVRLDIEALADEVWREIEKQQTPLGRVLIEHDVLRDVELCALWRVNIGPRLATLLQVNPGQFTYGRTALIHCDGVPAIELLEIVTPQPRDSQPVDC